jgi:site-specific recombinase XerD
MVNSVSTRAILTDGDLAANAASFARHPRAANLTPATQRAYLDGLTPLARFLTAAGMPTDVAAITREHVEAFITDQLARLAPASAANRYSSLRPFFNWLVEEGEIKASPMARMRKPKLPEHAPPILTNAELGAILRACEGPSFDDRRDAALVRVFLSTGARLSEVPNLRWTPEVPETNDVDLDAGIMRVMGKGRRERIAFLSPKAVRPSTATCACGPDTIPPRSPTCGWARRDA